MDGMTFELPEESDDPAGRLRELEPQAPKQFKGAMVNAADRIDDQVRMLRSTVEEVLTLKLNLCDLAIELEIAASLRAGQMDSQSRADEIAKSVRETMQGVAQQLRALA
jgi:hypothetical protein